MTYGGCFAAEHQQTNQTFQDIVAVSVKIIKISAQQLVDDIESCLVVAHNWVVPGVEFTTTGVATSSRAVTTGRYEMMDGVAMMGETATTGSGSMMAEGATTGSGAMTGEGAMTAGEQQPAV
ncbi:hypothetical protein BDD12DRAFT_805003 [Trichophaea hybrida]|nr:hypothetical protein BDD12DRAFT_805003 [Trichophaea hybrida]